MHSRTRSHAQPHAQPHAQTRTAARAGVAHARAEMLIEVRHAAAGAHDTEYRENQVPQAPLLSDRPRLALRAQQRIRPVSPVHGYVR
jgi:hypothetical protein